MLSRPGSRSRRASFAPGADLLRAHACLAKRLDAELERSHHLPMTSYEVLHHLQESPGGRMRMRDLADQAQLSRSGLTRLVDRLERDGLLERCSCSHDARGSYACLTEAGQRAPRGSPRDPPARWSGRSSSRTSARTSSPRWPTCGSGSLPAAPAEAPARRSAGLHVHVARVLRLARRPGSGRAPRRRSRARPRACAGGGGRGSRATIASSTAASPNRPNASIAPAGRLAQEVCDQPDRRRPHDASEGVPEHERAPRHAGGPGEPGGPDAQARG